MEIQETNDDMQEVIKHVTAAAIETISEETESSTVSSGVMLLQHLALTLTVFGTRDTADYLRSVADILEAPTAAQSQEAQERRRAAVERIYARYDKMTAASLVGPVGRA